MLIAQITDLHLGFEPGNPQELNRERLDRVLQLLTALDPGPDLLLATGDLTEHGDESSYRQLRESLSGLPFPVAYCLGNHDDRSTVFRVFDEVSPDGGFLQYSLDDFALRIVVIDTVKAGRHGGAFCEARAAWLDQRLAAEPSRPTLLALHHPPIPTGIDWMTVGPDEAWAGRLESVVARHSQIVASICGHIHRPMVSEWAGAPLIVCPSTAPQLALNLSPVDPEKPDGRPLVVEEAPGFALHLWTGERLLSHLGAAQDARVLARFDERMQPVLRHLFAERPGG